jgi:subtilisin family serine protease
MNADNQVADFSSSQQFQRAINPICPLLVGPGVDVTSCVPDGKFKTMDGTSMATPHIAGLAALLLQAQPTATANQLEAAIIGSCSLPGSMEQGRADHGVPDAEKAFQLLTGSPLQIASTALTLPKPGTARPRRTKRPTGRVAKKTAGRPKVAASSGPSRSSGRSSGKKAPSKRRRG